MMGLVISLLLLLGAAAFMWYRNQWVYKQCTGHIEAAHALVMKKCTAGVYILGEPYYRCIASHGTMMWKFWRWNLSDFATDQEKFDEVYGKENRE